MRRLLLEAARQVEACRRRLAGPEAPPPGGEFWRALWRDAAAELGARVEDLGGDFYEIRLGEAATRVFGKHVMLDDPVTLKLAGDKPLVHRLLAAAGLPVPEFAAFRLETLAAAYAFAGRVGGACVVKPARGTGGGRGVATGLRSRAEIRRAALGASLFGPDLLIERQVEGDVYRLLVLEGELLDAVRRRPPEVTGDGRSTLRRLIEAENRRRGARGGASALGRIELDVDCRTALRRAGHSLRSVPAQGERVTVTGISNAGGLAESESVRERIGKDLRAEAARAARVLGVRLAGVDVITKDPGVSLLASGGSVNEVNTTPGLQWHYLVRNPEQGVRVAVPLLRRLLAAGLPAADACGGPGARAPRDASAPL